MEAIPQPVNIIDLDNYVSTEETITKWHSKTRDRIKILLGMECETSLDNLMEWYVRTLNEDIFNIEVNRRFIVLLEKHIHCFYSYFKGLNWISADSYLDNMEQILAFYLDCQGRIFIREKGKQKRNKKMIRKRLLTMFNSYLFNEEDRIHHALMKMRLNLTCDDAKKFLDNVFRVVFSQKPDDQTDVAFCRAFILYQKWKRIQSPDIWSTLDEMLHQMYRREPDSIQTNDFWKEILPTDTSLIGIIAQFGESDKILCDAYFKYLKSLNTDESKINVDNLPKPNIDDEPNQFSILMESIAQLAENEGNSIVKTEIEIEDDDDDCVIISEDFVEIDPKEIVYEILDDDDDDVNNVPVADLKPKEPSSCSINNKSFFGRENEENVSFLDSIDISENDKDTNTGKNAILIDSAISPLPKLQNLDDNDSVKSREILSRKFTRKKEDVEKSTELVVESIEILDDLKSNDVAGRFDTETNNLHSSPHSTFISNNSPNSTESTEKKSKESYASPTSPDISSTCPEQEESDEPMEVQTEAETVNDVEAESTIDYTMTDGPVPAELPIYCFVAESVDDPIDPILDKIEFEVEDQITCGQTEAEIVEDELTSFNSEAEPTSDLVEVEPTSDLVEDEPTSELVEAEPTSDLVEAEPTSDLVKAEPTSDLVEAEPTSDLVEVEDQITCGQTEAEIVEDEPTSFNSEAEPTSGLVEAEPTSDLVEVGPTSDLVEAEQTSDLVEVGPTSDLVEAEQTSDLVEAEPTSDLVEAEQTSDLVEAEQTSDLVEVGPTSDLVEAQPTSDLVEAEPTSDLVEVGPTSDLIEAEPTSDLVETDAQTSDIVDPEDVNIETSRECIEAELDAEPAVEYIEAESTLTESLSVIGRKIEEEYTPKNTVRSDYGNSDRVESINNEEDCDIWKIKCIEQQVGATIPRIKVRKVKKRKMDVVYSQKVKSNNEVHHRYDSLKGGHDLDECLVGEVEKLDLSKNVTLNGITDFDLFADHVPPKEKLEKYTTTPCTTTTTTTSPSDLKSPEYDGIDDFKVYYASNQLQEYINDTTDNGSRINIQEKENILENDQIEKDKSPKKKKISFAKKNTVYTIESNPPLNIPTDQMSLKSLAKYKVKPTDAGLQGRVQIIVERCSEMEVKGWHKLSENTRRKRLENQSTMQFSSPSQVNPNSMTLVRINYDKSTPWPSENDIAHYREEEAKLWRSNDQHKFDISEEGRYNGRKPGKRKIQRSGVSDEHVVKKRGRPKKRT